VEVEAIFLDEDEEEKLVEENDKPKHSSSHEEEGGWSTILKNSCNHTRQNKEPLGFITVTVLDNLAAGGPPQFNGPTIEELSAVRIMTGYDGGNSREAILKWKSFGRRG
jgi:hypothetical protein